MTHDRSVREAIKQRFSCRNYRDQPIEAETRQQLADFIAARRVGPLGSQARFALVSGTEEDRSALQGLGTYGFIKGATGFIIGAVAEAPHDLEDFGYLMEEIILHATALKLGTCWLGGSFTRSSFADKIALQDGELLPAVVSVGYIAPKPGIIDWLIRRSAGSDHRLSWERLFFDGTFDVPLSQASAGAYAEPLAMVRLGPSASNKQPWRIVKADGAWHFYLEHTPGYGQQMRIVTPVDLQRVDIGIAMCHFALTAEMLGLQGEWVVRAPDLDLPDDMIDYTVSWLEEN